MTMRLRVSLMLIAAAAMISFASCDHYNCASGPTLGSTCTATGSGLSGGGTSGTASAFAFAVDQDGNIDGYTLSTGAGTFAATTDYTGGSIPPNAPGQGMVVAQGKYLYTSFPGLGVIYGSTISSSGDLTAITGSPFSATYTSGSAIPGTRTLITNPAGTLLFALDQNGDAVYVYQIGSGGTLTLVSGSPFLVPFLPENMATDGLGNYLYVTPTGSQSLSELAAYAINSTTGTLTPVQNSPFSLGLVGMVQVEGDPSGKYLIGTTGSPSDNHLYVFSITQSGAVTAVTGSPFTTVYPPYTIAVQSNTGGNLVYSFSGNTTPIEGYQLNTSTGALTAVSGSPFSTLSTGLWGQFDQTGAFLFVWDSALTQLAPFAVSSSGVLTQPIPPVTTVDGTWAVSDVP